MICNAYYYYKVHYYTRMVGVWRSSFVLVREYTVEMHAACNAENMLTVCASALLLRLPYDGYLFNVTHQSYPIRKLRKLYSFNLFLYTTVVVSPFLLLCSLARWSLAWSFFLSAITYFLTCLLINLYSFVVLFFAINIYICAACALLIAWTCC